MHSRTLGLCFFLILWGYGFLAAEAGDVKVSSGSQKNEKETQGEDKDASQTSQEREKGVADPNVGFDPVSSPQSTPPEDAPEEQGAEIFSPSGEAPAGDKPASPEGMHLPEVTQEISPNVPSYPQRPALAPVRGQKVRDIVVHGNARIEKQVILDHLEATLDNVYSPEQLNDFTKSLFATGLFRNVRLYVKDHVLHVVVQENALVNQIAIEGCRQKWTKDLKDLSPIKARDVFSLQSVQDFVSKIKSFYRAKGYYGATIKPKVIRRSSNRIDLVIVIQENKRTFIRRIRFLNNKRFSEKNLSGVITSKEEKWWRFMGDPGECYDKLRLEHDCNLIRLFYYTQGYMDAQIDYHAELTPSGEDFYITFYIKEGKPYHYGKTRIESKVKGISGKELRDLISWVKGEQFHHERPQEVASLMNKELEKKGWIFVSVEPVSRTNAKDHSVDVDFVIKNTTRLYVRRLFIKGNYATNDTVLRREMLLTEGDPISFDKTQDSKKNLEALDFFESVDVKEEDTQDPQLKDLVVNVKEKSTGDFKLSGGYNTQDAVIGQVALSERNLLGRGLAGKIDVMASFRGFLGQFELRDPRFMNRRLDAGVSIFASTFRGETQGKIFSKKGAYLQQNAGTEVDIGYFLCRDISQVWTYGIRFDHINRVGKDMSLYIRQNLLQHRSVYISSVQHDIRYSTLDMVEGDVVRGRLFEISTCFRGLGGNVRFLSNVFTLENYTCFDEDRRFILRLSGRFGHIHKIGYMRFADQFMLGLYSFPGFGFSGIGPRDIKSEDALYGRRYYTASAKAYISLDFLGLPKELPLKAVFFAQTGSLWNPIFRGPFIDSSKFKNRVSAGGGLILTLPMVGKVGFVWAKALQKQKCDITYPFLIVWGTDF